MLTLGQAAKTARRGKSTIHKALKDGTLSGIQDESGQWAIDPAELHRVFPMNGSGSRPRTSQDELREQAQDRSLERSDAQDARVALLTEALERERALNDELRADLRAERERVAAFLTPPKRRIWWPWR